MHISDRVSSGRCAWTSSRISFDCCRRELLFSLRQRPGAAVWHFSTQSWTEVDPLRSLWRLVTFLWLSNWVEACPTVCWRGWLPVSHLTPSKIILIINLYHTPRANNLSSLERMLRFVYGGQCCSLAWQLPRLRHAFGVKDDRGHCQCTASRTVLSTKPKDAQSDWTYSSSFRWKPSRCGTLLLLPWLSLCGEPRDYQQAWRTCVNACSPGLGCAYWDAETRCQAEAFVLKFFD